MKFVRFSLCILILFWAACEFGERRDVDPPTVKITRPAADSTVFDKVTIQATAEDENTVSSMEILVDGDAKTVTVIDNKTFEYSWNTTASADSSEHTLSARATDEMGNTGQASAVSVIVNNAGRPPVPITVNEPYAVGKHQMSLSWEKSIDKDFLNYLVYRSTNDSMAQKILVDTIPGIQTTSLTDNGLNADSSVISDYGLIQNTNYYYQVVVNDTFGLQGESNIVSAKTAFTEPAILKDDFSTTKYTATTNWYPSEDEIEYYRIHRSRRSDMGNVLQDSVGWAPEYAETFTDSGLTSLTAYYYRVFAIDESGYASGSNEIRVQTKGIQAVEIAEPKIGDIGKYYVTVTWNASAEEDSIQYELYKSLAGTVTNEDSLIFQSTDRLDTTFTDYDVTDGTDYSYVVYISDSRESQAKSNILNVTTLTVYPLEIYPVSISKYSAEIAWETYPYDDFHSYRIFRGSHTNFDTSNAQKQYTFTNKNETSLSETDLNLETEYYYKLITSDTYGNEALSEVNFKTPGVLPVELLETKPVNDQYFTLTFTASKESDFKKYQIYRDTLFSVTADDQMIKTITIQNDTVYDDKSNLEMNQEYYYRIYVTDSRDNRSVGSNVLGDTLDTPPEPVRMWMETSTSKTIRMSWNTSNAIDFLKYVLYRSPTEDIEKDDGETVKITEILDINTTTFLDSNLESGQVFYYRLYVYDQNGNNTACEVVYGYTKP